MSEERVREELAEAPAEALREGTGFGPFEIVREVGRGAFGVVYEARRRPLQRRVALKVLHPHVLARPEALRRFERELAAAAAVSHPNVVALHDGGVIDGRGFMAMSFLEGESLSERLRARGSLSVEESVDAMLPIAAALEAVHAAGIVHRDIKPANVFLARAANGGDHPVLLDFGVAKDLEDPSADLTRSQSWLGTPTYMSPEQIRQSKDVSARSDQWSFGVVLYECLVGQRPFDHEVLLELMQAITSEDPEAPHARRASVPTALSAVVMRALARAPEARFASMRALGAALLPFASDPVRSWWRPYFIERAEAAREPLTSVREGDAPRVPGRLPDPEGALPTLMANQPAIAAPPVPPVPSAKTRSGQGKFRPSGRPSSVATQSADRDRTVIVSAPPRSAVDTLLRYGGVAAIAGFAFFAGRNITAPPAAPPPSVEPAGDGSRPPPPAPAAAFDDVTASAPRDAGAITTVTADASAPDAQSVDARGADAPSAPASAPSVARSASPPRPRNGSIQILCGAGRATIGDDSRAREVSLPAMEPIPWPAGYVRVMINSPRGQRQAYVTVRAGHTTTFQECPGL